MKRNMTPNERYAARILQNMLTGAAIAAALLLLGFLFL